MEGFTFSGKMFNWVINSPLLSSRMSQQPHRSIFSFMFAFQPELRYWFCDKFNGHFVGAHLHGGVYQAAAIDMPWGIWPELKDHRFKGHFYGFGVSYGYQWILGKHWNLEGNIGIGYARVKYEQFECKTCGEKVKEGHKNYVGPTKAAVSLIYLF